MRLSISNLAWNPEYDDRIAGLLHAFAFDAIEIAPGKYFPIADAKQESNTQGLDAVRRAWQECGIDIVAMQALLFGTTGLNMFGSPAVQEAMLNHLARIAAIGGALGAKRLVFGSPKNRDRSGIDDATTTAMAIDFFRRLGDIAAASGCIVCLEANPAAYGCNFMLGTAEAAEMVRETAHPAIRLQFDIGSVTANGEDAADLLVRYRELIGHVHISEPGLQPLGRSAADHAHLGALLRHALPPDMTVSIEMLTPATEDPVAAVRSALGLAVRHYRHPGS
ncbi:sugar phosphate isomerase/epimerase [Massilia sp. Dwa41.01b]|uniref:sugar phosphate isomerase/epimerase family protein n=1 Tax=unclassified Massilia TaxID=2609279 RepID=UPI001600D85A|nr:MULTISPECIES: TIM barrel protein [unclassified Massilia]QNA88519.1 sugar phosphate isomerase/epimerase [Massilia sp. Dwa41.01b]QNA99416.1 sugar phosphate isomerase/epimerase [Massilia sp. Se16.2.3]